VVWLNEFFQASAVFACKARAMSPAILILSQDSDFEANVLRALAHAFSKRGVACAWHNKLLPYEQLLPWLVDNDIALCLEYGRTLPRLVPWPDHIIHCGWVVDYRQHGQDMLGDLGVSHHLYFIMHPRAYGLNEITDLAGQSWSMLLPGARPTNLSMASPSALFDYDFCLAGFIPAPLDYDSPLGTTPNGEVVTLNTIMQGFPIELLHMANLNIDSIRKTVHARLAELHCTPFDTNNILQLFDDILVRTVDRRALLEGIQSWNQSLALYGPPTWMQWPQFAPYYRGFLEPGPLDAAMRRAKINLHNGCLGFHYRVADAIAAGAFIMINRTSMDNLPGGIATFLEPEVEYAPFEFDGFETLARGYLADRDRRDRIIAAGRRAVLARHTWDNRADQIINDFDLSPCAEPVGAESRILQASLDNILK